MSTENNDKYLFMLGEISGKLDSLMAQAKADRRAVDRLTERVNRLEAWRWKLWGGAMTVGGASGFIAKFF